MDPPLDQDRRENQLSTGEEGHCTGEEEALKVLHCNVKRPCMSGEGPQRVLDLLA